MIFCNKCKTEKSENSFNVCRSNSTGRQSWCKECRKDYNKQSRSNMDALKKLKIAEQDRQRAKKNRQQRKLTGQKYIRPIKKTKDEMRFDVGHRSSMLLARAKERHKKKPDLPFDITHRWVVSKLEQGRCERSGLYFDLSRSTSTHRNPLGPSLDRIDNKRGYTKDNVQIVCNMYNGGKGQHSDEEFIAFCHAVANNNPL